MPTIQTVCGPIEPEALGITLGHEHLLIDLRGLWDEPATEERRALAQTPITLASRATWAQNPYESRDNLVIDDEAAAAEELRAFAQAGGRSVIDMTVEGLDPGPRRCGASRGAVASRSWRGLASTGRSRIRPGSPA